MLNEYIEAPSRPNHSLSSNNHRAPNRPWPWGTGASNMCTQQTVRSNLQYHSHEYHIHNPSPLQDTPPVTMHESQHQQNLAKPTLSPQPSMQGPQTSMTGHSNPYPKPSATLAVPQPCVRHACAPPVISPTPSPHFIPQVHTLIPSYSLMTPAPQAPQGPLHGPNSLHSSLHQR